MRAGMPGCPLPAGPYTDEAGRLRQAHHRAEKGTTCWLAGRCSRPRAVLYDADIARGLQAAFARSGDFATASLWVTVQARVVYLEGCVSSTADAAALEALARTVPEVEQAIAIVRVGAGGDPPYRPMPP